MPPALHEIGEPIRDTTRPRASSYHLAQGVELNGCEARDDVRSQSRRAQRRRKGEEIPKPRVLDIVVRPIAGRALRKLKAPAEDPSGQVSNQLIAVTINERLVDEAIDRV